MTHITKTLRNLDYDSYTSLWGIAIIFVECSAQPYSKYSFYIIQVWEESQHSLLIYLVPPHFPYCSIWSIPSHRRQIWWATIRQHSCRNFWRPCSPTPATSRRREFLYAHALHILGTRLRVYGHMGSCSHTLIPKPTEKNYATWNSSVQN